MGKETVLALLLREKGHFVSGEAVSAELGITRAAIWKSISALRVQEKVAQGGDMAFLRNPFCAAIIKACAIYSGTSPFVTRPCVTTTRI